jgi:aldehyde:ferredoxin oxidoreductase
MAYGYNGKILHVDLTSGVVRTEEPPEQFYRRYYGGSALGLYYLLKNSPAHVDPLGPDNTLVLALSVLTGVPISGQSRVTAVAKSPLTGAVGDTQGGGFWPAELKFAGFDAIVLTGRSEQPVYLWVHDGEADLREASHLSGKLTGEVDRAIRDELDDARVQVLQCGPAGEKGVRFACLISMCNRANGRTGMGAVMGAKNLRAVAVRGSARPNMADEESVRSLAKWVAEKIDDSDVASLGILGTAEIVTSQDEEGGLPTRNWSSGAFEDHQAISGQTMHDTILKKRDTCYGCAVRCKRVVEVTEGPYQVDPLYGGPEYETLAALGSYCGVGNLEAVAKANELCNAYGLDTISCGGTISWAMECFEKGILTTKETDGIDLRFGNAEAMVTLVEMIGRREGFGDVLAEGSARAAQAIGRASEDFLVTVKKQEAPAHMPQVKRSLALIYAVNPFGADHQSHEHDPAYDAEDGYLEEMAELGLLDPQPVDGLDAEKVRFAFYTQCIYSALDSLNLCQFVYGPAWQLYGLDQMVELVRATTGWRVSLWELMKLGERRLNMLRAFNTREGIGREADVLPEKFYKPLQGGASDGVAVEREALEKALATYYEMAGWNIESGTPGRAKLEELGIGWVADDAGLH